MNIKRIKDDFRLQLEAVKIRKNWTDEELARYLGASRATISNMKANPFSVRGQYILMVQAIAEEEGKK